MLGNDVGICVGTFVLGLKDGDTEGEDTVGTMVGDEVEGIGVSGESVGECVVIVIVFDDFANRLENTGLSAGAVMARMVNFRSFKSLMSGTGAVNVIPAEKVFSSTISSNHAIDDTSSKSTVRVHTRSITLPGA